MPAFLLPLISLFAPAISDGLGHIAKKFFGGDGEPRTVEERVQLMDAEINMMKARAELTKAESGDSWNALSGMAVGTYKPVQAVVVLLGAVVLSFREGTRPILAWAVMGLAGWTTYLQVPEAPIYIELAFTAFNYYLGDRGYRYARGLLGGKK